VERIPATDLHRQVLGALDRADRTRQTSRELVALAQALHVAVVATLAETERLRAARTRTPPRD
jgi:hypothetical protein